MYHLENGTVQVCFFHVAFEQQHFDQSISEQ